MNNNKTNIEAKSKFVSGIVRSLPAFIIGGPIGLVTNFIYTATNVNKEIKEEEIRYQKRIEMLSHDKITPYCPSSIETEMMLKDYREKYKQLKITKLHSFITYKSNRFRSSSNNWIVPCSFYLDNDKKKGYIMCTYDFWNEFYKHPSYKLKKYRIRNGKDYMCFTTNGIDYFFGSCL